MSLGGTAVGLGLLFFVMAMLALGVWLIHRFEDRLDQRQRETGLPEEPENLTSGAPSDNICINRVSPETPSNDRRPTPGAAFRLEKTMFRPQERLIAEQDCNLTVGALLQLLQQAGLPDDTPVYYQRIGDSYFKKQGWTVVRMPWDFERLREGQDVKESGDLRLMERNGIRCIAYLDDFIPAWSAHVSEDPAGSKALVICAHY